MARQATLIGAIGLLGPAAAVALVIFIVRGTLLTANVIVVVEVLSKQVNCCW